MPRHDPASRARIADYQCRHNGGNGSDPDLSREHGAESRLDVKAADGVLHVTNNTLDLDDHQHADGGCVRQKVDAPPVSVMVEADLGVDDPSPRDELPRYGFLNGGMCCIQESIQPLASPPELDVKMSAQSFGKQTQGTKRHALEVGTFEA